MFKATDYRDRKINKEKVVPYDTLRPYVKILEEQVNSTYTEYEFSYTKLNGRIKKEEALSVQLAPVSEDYKLLWRCLLFSLNDTKNKISQDDSLLSDERNVLNRLVLEALIKKHTLGISFIQTQSSKIQVLKELSILEVLFLAIIKLNTVIVKNGFSGATDQPIKKVKLTKRNFTLFLKWVYEYEVDISIYDIIRMYVENTEDGLFMKDSPIVFKTEEMKAFNEVDIYAKGKEVSFNRKSSDKGIPISFLYIFLSAKASIYGFEQFRVLSDLLKKNLVVYDKGLLSVHKNVSFIDGEIIDDIMEYIKEGKREDFMKVFQKITEESEIICPICKESGLFFNKGVFCAKCKFSIRNQYYKENILTHTQLGLLATTGQILYFKNKKNPMILYLTRDEGNRFKLTSNKEKRVEI